MTSEAIGRWPLAPPLGIVRSRNAVKMSAQPSLEQSSPMANGQRHPEGKLMPGADASSTTDPKPRLHGELLSTSLLAFLKNWNAYGYQLAQRLAESGMPECDSGTIYRTLRQLEKSGFVSSFWDTSESGPARRMYSLTNSGDLFLNGWLAALANYQDVIQKAMSDWQQFARGVSPNPAPRAEENTNA